MSYQSDIFLAMQSNVAMTALIGDRFAWDVADGTTAAPYIVAQEVSDGSKTDFDGNRDLSFPLVQFSCWAKGKAEAISIMAAFRREIEGKNLPGDSKASLGFAGSHSTRDPQTKLYGEIRDYRISANSN